LNKNDENLEFQKDDFFIFQERNQTHIDEIVEFQNNQFNPGYYIGTGRVLPAIKAPGNAMPIAIWLFIQAIGY
jgi:hypothetical protein